LRPVEEEVELDVEVEVEVEAPDAPELTGPPGREEPV
jgi:hypothetical protein